MKAMTKFFSLLLVLCVLGSCVLFTACSDKPEEPGEPSVPAKEADPETTVQVEGGQIAGYSEDGLYIYKGIPFMAQPVGELRWQDPRPAEAWEGVKDCVEFGANFYQPKSAAGEPYTAEFLIDNDLGISEEGISMNIWAPADLSEAKEVLVYIHGGALMSGSGSVEIYSGEELAKQGIVCVTFNYRLGNFGKFACTELSARSDSGGSGNYSLKDCVAALEWVQENISAFGGDPDKVTIMGQSAGAGLVSMLCVSPKAEGLFRGAVISSGNSLATASLPTLEEMEKIGDERMNGKTLDELLALSAREVSLLSFSGVESYCIDGVYLTEASAEMLRSGKWNDVTILTGYVSGDISLSGGSVPSTKEDYETQVCELFGEECLSAYPSEGTEDYAAQFEEIYRDAQIAKLNYIAQLAAEGGSEKDVYIWFFTHVIPGPQADKLGCFHTADIPYFMNIFSAEREGYWTQADYDVGAMMAGYLVNFVKTGDPNGKDINGEDLTAWQPCEQADNYLFVAEESEMRSLTDAQTQFWTDYYKEGGNILF